MGTKMVILACTHTSDGSAIKLMEQVPTELPVLLITRPDGYVFNETILGLKGKPYILANMEEMGWDAPLEKTHLFGVNTDQFRHLYDTDEWRRLDDFIAANPPVLTFQRELLSKDASDTVVPINFPCTQPIPETVSKDEFYKRPLDVFYTWGYSHPERRRLHGQIWIDANKHDYVVCDNPYFLERFLAFENNAHRWVTSNIPDYCRFQMEQIITMQGLSRISISMPGAGRVCFRHTESPINSVMMMWDDNIKWSYPWISGVNCIKSQPGKEIETIIGWLNSPDLFEVYLAGVDNCRKYETKSYVENYLFPLIKNL